MSAYCSSVLLFLMVCCVSPPTQPEPPTVFPDAEWVRSPPERQFVRADRLGEALDWLATHCGENGLEETLVVRHGYLIWAGDSIDRVHDIWSCTKSFTSTIAGLLEADGRLRLDQPLAELEPSLGPRYPDATVRHFLTMTSGYDAVGATRWPGDVSEDWSRTPYDPAPPLFPPGTAYAYWDEAMIKFGQALTRTAGQTLNDFFHERVGGPIGLMRRPWWGEGKTADGIPINFGGTGLKLSAAEQARYGWLMANDGVWDGRRLLPPGWVARATVNQVGTDVRLGDTDRRGTDGRGIYGFNWWVINATKRTPAAYYSSGLNHNVCLVIPDWQMVVVRQGTDGNPPAGKHFVYTEFLRRLAGAVR